MEEKQIGFVSEIEPLRQIITHSKKQALKDEISVLKAKIFLLERRNKELLEKINNK